MSTQTRYTFRVDAMDLEQAQFRATLSEQDPAKSEPRTLATIEHIDQLNEPLRELLTDELRNHASAEQDKSLLALTRNPLDPASLRRAFIRAGVIDAAVPFAMNNGDCGTYGYSINMDERGEFSADVRDLADYSVFSIYTIDGLESLIETGEMHHKDDLSGLEDHLQQAGIIGSNAQLLPLNKFEDFQNEYIADGKLLFEHAKIRDAVFAQADYVVNSHIEVTVDHGLPSIDITDTHDPENAIHLQEHEADAFLEEAQTLSDNAVVSFQDACYAAAKGYAEALEPSQGPTLG